MQLEKPDSLNCGYRIIESTMTYRDALHEFIHAAAYGNTGRLAELLATGMNPDAKLNGDCALHHATSSNQPDCVELLIKTGADVDSLASTRRTSSMIASDYGHAQCLRLLVEAGADTEKLDAAGLNAARIATLGGRAACLQTLLDAGSPVDVVDRLGKTHAMHAAEDGLHDVLAILFEAGCGLTLASKNGMTATMYAIENGHAHCAQSIEAEIERRLIASFCRDEARRAPAAQLRV
jgi:ankyrin repeat protein